MINVFRVTQTTTPSRFSSRYFPSFRDIKHFYSLFGHNNLFNHRWATKLNVRQPPIAPESFSPANHHVALAQRPLKGAMYFIQADLSYSGRTLPHAAGKLYPNFMISVGIHEIWWNFLMWSSVMNLPLHRKSWNYTGLLLRAPRRAPYTFVGLPRPWS